jgi:hypothetical protein
METNFDQTLKTAKMRVEKEERVGEGERWREREREGERGRERGEREGEWNLSLKNEWEKCKARVAL